MTMPSPRQFRLIALPSSNSSAPLTRSIPNVLSAPTHLSAEVRPWISSGQGPEAEEPCIPQGPELVFLGLSPFAREAFDVWALSHSPGRHYPEQSTQRSLDRYTALRNIPLLNHRNLGLLQSIIKPILTLSPILPPTLPPGNRLGKD